MKLDVGHAIVLGPGEGEVITERDARTVRLKVGLDAIAVTETRYERGERGPDAHVHRRHTDAFYVLEGGLVFELGPKCEHVEGPEGTFVAAPPGVVHSFRNDGPGRARFLNFHAPSERFHDHLRGMSRGRTRAGLTNTTRHRTAAGRFPTPSFTGPAKVRQSRSPALPSF
jgi:quercetin dioxygenase-like cupin family protein